MIKKYKLLLKLLEVEVKSESTSICTLKMCRYLWGGGGGGGEGEEAGVLTFNEQLVRQFCPHIVLANRIPGSVEVCLFNLYELKCGFQNLSH